MSAVPALKESWLAALFAVLVDDGADGADVLVLAEPAAVAPTPLSTTVAESVCCG